jgi:peroxiredoxin
LRKSDATVLAISVDDPKTVAAFAKDIGADYSLLSDDKREVAALYGVLDPGGQRARRTTFVVDRDGVVQKIDEGSAALDPAGVISFCSLKKKPS